ncbi:MAG: diguanylate cyclase [Sandaracinus sp.]|nr:diguanylate cyclase [Sandaracinus sp.]MCB9616050.1 diguanylate cyclase [Sandaracinus sp.]MCB9632433.1 diguanylate cyclase [Sandaracinus sp.]
MSPLALRILERASSPDCRMDELADLAQRDPSFALRVLRVVNSPAFRRAHAVQDIRQAASMLGVRGLRSVALGLVVVGMVPVGELGDALLCGCLRRGAAARALCLPLGETDLDRGYTLGLLLEAGFLAASVQHPEQVLELMGTPTAHRVLREQLLGAVPHTRLGAQLARRNFMPDEVCEAIESHHDELPPASSLARVGWLAERVAAVFEPGDPARARLRALEAATAVGVPEPIIEALLSRLPSEVAETAEGFERPVNGPSDVDAMADAASTALVELNLEYEQLVRHLRAVLEEKDELLRAKDSLEKELRELTQSLKHDASTDALTGLPNRRAFDKHCARMMAEADATGSPLSLLVLDLDFFKRVNDSYGHAAGDAVLARLARLLLAELRPEDSPARFGGEEFVVLLPGTTTVQALAVAERVRKRVESTRVLTAERRIAMTVSIGVSTYRRGRADEAQALFERSDAALYEAKRRGRNCVVVAASPGMGGASTGSLHSSRLR